MSSASSMPPHLQAALNTFQRGIAAHHHGQIALAMGHLLRARGLFAPEEYRELWVAIEVEIEELRAALPTWEADTAH